MQKNKNKLAVIIICLLFAIMIGNVIVKQTAATQENASKSVSANDNYAEQQPSDVEDMDEAQIIDRAPDFELMTLGGKAVRLSDYTGKKVLLNFWATWCPPCKAEAPHMQAIYEQYEAAGVEILAVNVTSQDHGKEAIHQFVQQYGLTFPTLLDVDGEVALTYRILTLPTTYFIDEEGGIAEVISGPMDEPLMHEILYQMDNGGWNEK